MQGKRKMLAYFCILALCSSLTFGHPSREGTHEHPDQAATIVKLKNNIRTMEGLLAKQERRLVVGFQYLQKKVGSLTKMAAKAESELHGDQQVHANCSVPVAPTNGHILGIRYDGDGAHVPPSGALYFVCDEGFHLQGSEERQCLGNGTWSGLPVACIDITSKIAACSKLKCQNGGMCTRIESSEKYVCKCARGFYGKKCQKVHRPPSNNGEIIRAICFEQDNEETCSCHPGYTIGVDHNLCFDIDECADQTQPSTDVIPDDVGSMVKRYTRHRRPLCRHRCVNTPGSYTCTCPPGYVVDPKDTRSCQDIDECELGTDDCSDGQNCFNTGGGFKCVDVLCPPSYFHTSPFICQRERCTVGDRRCLREAFTYAFNFIDLPSNLAYPADVFSLVADEGSSVNTNRFTVLDGPHSDYFKCRKTNPLTGMLVLRRPFDGLESVTVDLEMMELTSGRRRRLVAKYVYRITFFMSLYDF